MPELNDQELQSAIEFLQAKHGELMNAVAVLIAEADKLRLSLAGLILLSQHRQAMAKAAEGN